MTTASNREARLRAVVRDRRRRALAASLGFALLLGSAFAASPEDEARMVLFTNRFGEQASPTGVGAPITSAEAGQRFMYALQTQFESFTSGYTTTVIVEFPASVVPDIAVYAEFASVVGNQVRIENFPRGGFSINLPFDVKPEDQLPGGATEIRMKTSISVVTVNSGTLQNTVEDVLPLVRDTPFTAAVSAAPAEVQLTDPEAVITLTVTFQNTGDATLRNVAPFGDPIPSVADAVEVTGGPTPPSVDPLAAGASGSLAYTFKPKKAGPVRFSFERFLAQSPSGVVEVGTAQSNEVAIKEDVTVEVTVEPAMLQTDSTAAAAGTVRIKVTNPTGDPVSGQRIALAFPQYFGVVDLNPRLLICGSDGTIAFPPGASPTLNDAAYGTTPASGELAYQLHLGTQRRTAQLFVKADATDASQATVAEDGVQVDLLASGSIPNPTAYVDLDALQRADLPEAQRAAFDASIVGRGAPVDVLRALVSWLETKREAGPGLVRDVDWVPIGSRDDQHVGVLIYPRAQLDEVVAHFEGGPAVANAYVLQIEKAALGVLGHEVKWERPWMALDTWENTPLDEQGLPIPGGTDIPRLRAKTTIELVTASPYAFLGYPYPAAGASADSGYGAGCVPTLNGVGVSVHSPVTLLVKDALGRALGFDATGTYVNDVPGAVYSAGEPARYLLPPGRYQADILGTDKGPASIVLSAPGVAPKTFTLKAKAGKTGTLTFDDTLASATGTFNKKKVKVADGVPITVTGVKKKIRVRSGDPLTLTVTSAFGNPVAGARVHATGKGFDAETLTGSDGVAALPLVVTKATKKLTVVIDGAGVQPKTLKVRVKLLK
jgi:uncharacterized repeat protein (TIGR01451 family)